jgi:asparagine synthase (glutamine-hydrolysing)
MVYRPKEGFFMPVSDWLRTNLETYVRETLSPSRLERHGLFDAGEVQRLVDELYSGGNDYRHANKVLSLLMFQEWHEAYAE